MTDLSDWAQYSPEELGEHVAGVVADMVRSVAAPGGGARALEDVIVRLERLERRLKAIERRLDVIL